MPYIDSTLNQLIEFRKIILGMLFILGSVLILSVPCVAQSYTYQAGQRNYECINHLGNVLETVSDKKIRFSLGFHASVIFFTDYYPYGMQMMSRKGYFNSLLPYRYGFNGMEIDMQLKGNGNSYTTPFRQYDPRLGRWLSQDPLVKKYVFASPYSAFNNNPVYFKDPSGMEGKPAGGKEKRRRNRSNRKMDEKVYSVLRDKHDEIRNSTGGSNLTQDQVNAQLNSAVDDLNNKYRKRRWFRYSLAPHGRTNRLDGYRDNQKIELSGDMYTNLKTSGELFGSNWTGGNFSKIDFTIDDPQGLTIDIKRGQATEEEFSRGTTEIEFDPLANYDELSVYSADQNGQRTLLAQSSFVGEGKITISNADIVGQNLVFVVNEVVMPGQATGGSSATLKVKVSIFRPKLNAPVTQHDPQTR